MRVCPYCKRRFQLEAAFVAHLTGDALARDRRGRSTALFKSSPGDTSAQAMCKYSYAPMIVVAQTQAAQINEERWAA